MNKRTTNNKNGTVFVTQKNRIVKVMFSGDIAELDGGEVVAEIRKYAEKGAEQILLDTEKLGSWDSSVLLVVFEAVKSAKENNIECDISNLPENMQQLVHLALAVNRKPTRAGDGSYDVFETLGRITIGTVQKVTKVLAFIGDSFSAIGRFFVGRSITRSIDFYAALSDCGPKALGIISLISFLVGLILAFVGAVQLREFGAQIYVASLVTIGMCRIMGAIMVGIIMAGRTGSAYAATIGTMQVNEELDALQTMGLSRMDFLVLPRLLALVLAMPILTMLADFMGMVGGAFVGVFMLDIPYHEYWRFAVRAFKIGNFLVGIFHGICFGFIIALCGCYQGLNCGRNADSVGVATTKSVVSAVVYMIVATGIITVICQELGI